jgi:hypothetical protein
MMLRTIDSSCMSCLSYLSRQGASGYIVLILM